MLTINLDDVRRTAESDPVRAGVLRRHLEARRSALVSGDFADLPPNVNAEAWLHQIDQALEVLRG
jgi:hypothetical protein